MACCGGRYNKVTGFHFVLHLPEAKEPEKELPALSDGMEERLREYGVHWSTARRLAKMPHAEECLQIALEHIREGKARNPAAYIKAAIEQDWQGQREAVRMALEAEHRERMGKQERRMDSAAGDAGCPERPLRSLAEIAEGDSPFSEMARKILDRRKKAARSKQASTDAGGDVAEKAAPKRGTAGKERKGREFPVEKRQSRNEPESFFPALCGIWTQWESADSAHSLDTRCNDVY